MPWLRTVAALAVLALAVAAGLAHGSPPPTRPASAPAGLFSAERAMRPLASIAARPHPTGTAAASAVRAEIVATLTTLGFEVAIQDATVVNGDYARWGWPTVAGHVRNVAARKAGTAGGPAVLLGAHYDSRELAPGASDDGYGTAVLLEAARALSVSPPLRHDVLLLFTEGEEQGLLGARAFVQESPLARNVAVAINVDCRGDRGPGVMFETSERAADLVETLGRVVPGVSATSLSQEVYRRMPNDTDLTVWLRAGHAGMNFGNIDGFERYHQPTDTLENADAGTVQSLGDAALAMVRALADRETVLAPATHDDTYFDVGPLLMRYDARDALPLGIMALAALIAATIVSWRRKRVTFDGVAAGAAGALLVPVLAGLLGLALLEVATRVSPAITTQTVRDAVRKESLASFLLLGAGVGWAAGGALARRFSLLSLVAGMAMPGAAVAIVTGVRVPGASFPFLWPALATAVALVGRALAPRVSSRHPALAAALLVAPALACLLLAPLAWQLGIAFGPRAAPALAAVAAIGVLPAAASARAIELQPLRVTSATLLAVALGLLLSAVTAPPHDANSPQPDSLLYAVDDDGGHAWWLSVDDAADAWTGRVLAGARVAPRPELFPRPPQPSLLQAPAPLVPHRGPRVSILSDENEGASRRLQLQVTPTPDAEAVEILVPAASRVTAAKVQGRAFGPGSDGWIDLAFAGPPEDGLELELTGPGGPISVTVIAHTRGLPEGAAGPLGPRPAGLMPEVARNPLRASDMTLVEGTFAF